MGFSIVHVTDFHIAQSMAEDEYLRERFYREYLDPLLSLISGSRMDVRGIIATGDFVDRGHGDGFEHAATVLRYIADGLGLRGDGVVLCNGNHDLIRSLEEARDPEGAREPFVAFASKFANAKAIVKEQRFRLCALASEVWVLMLDSTLGSNGEDRPGDLSVAEADAIVEAVRTNVPDTGYLVVGCHHPVIWPNESMMPTQEEHYYDRHIWTPALALAGRIASLRSQHRTVWLSGDVHAPGALLFQNNHYHITSGRLGARVGCSDSPIQREVRVVEFADEDGPRIYAYKYVVEGHNPSAQYGTWEENEVQTQVVSREELRDAELSAERDSVGASASSVEQTADPTGAKVFVLNRDLESEVMDTVLVHDLYRLGRFDTADGQSSLSWVSIGPMMNLGQLFARTVDIMTGYVEDWLGRHDLRSRDAVLLGVDCWGAAIASQISVGVGVRCYCVAARGRGAYSTDNEVVNAVVGRAVGAAKGVVLVTDVVASGQSLRYVYDELLRNGVSEDQAKSISWACLSVIYDSKQHRSKCLEFIDEHGTACASLRMPILEWSDLPSHNVLPASVSFVEGRAVDSSEERRQQ